MNANKKLLKCIERLGHVQSITKQKDIMGDPKSRGYFLEFEGKREWFRRLCNITEYLQVPQHEVERTKAGVKTNLSIKGYKIHRVEDVI